MKNTLSPTSDDLKEVHVWCYETSEASQQEEAFLGKYFETLGKGDAVLDIGCGQGRLVKALQQRGYKVLGIDLNDELIATALEDNLPVKKLEALEAIRRELSRYNVFSMLDFVEHIPLEVLINILKIISTKPGAKLWIQTPNLDSIMGIKFWFQVPSHITPLNPHVLHKLLDRFGYVVTNEWTGYGGLPWTGFRRWCALKIINGLFGAPMASMFIGGGNICLVAKVREP